MRSNSPTSAEPPISDDVAAVVKRYFELAADLPAPPDALGELLHPALRIVEHPNAVNPNGARRNREQALAAYATGKHMLASQTIHLHELLVSDDRAAARCTWRGTLAQDVGPLTAGSELSAEVAGFLSVKNGMIISHETFDCYGNE